MREMRKYKVQCIRCKKWLTVTDQPNQQPCECGSKMGIYKGQLVGWVWKNIRRKK